MLNGFRFGFFFSIVGLVGLMVLVIMCVKICDISVRVVIFNKVKDLVIFLNYYELFFIK